MPVILFFFNQKRTCVGVSVRAQQSLLFICCSWSVYYLLAIFTEGVLLFSFLLLFFSYICSCYSWEALSTLRLSFSKLLSTYISSTYHLEVFVFTGWKERKKTNTILERTPLLFCSSHWNKAGKSGSFSLLLLVFSLFSGIYTRLCYSVFFFWRVLCFFFYSASCSL